MKLPFIIEKELPGIKRSLISAEPELPLQFPAMVLDTAIKIYQITIQIIKNLQSGMPVPIEKEPGPAKYFDIAARLLFRKAFQKLPTQLPFSAYLGNKAIHNQPSPFQKPACRNHLQAGFTISNA